MVVLFDSVSDRYGSSRICQLVLEFLQSNGVVVHCFVGEERRQKDCYGKALRMPLLVMSYLRNHPIRYLLETLRTALWMLMRQREIFGESELVYCNTLATLPMAVIGRLSGRRTLVHMHETSSSSWMRRAGGYVLRRLAHRTICVSNAVAQSWDLEGLKSTSIVRNGIPVDNIEPNKSQNVNDMKYDICFVGRLSAKKGIGTFLQAIEELRKSQCVQGPRPLRVGIAGGSSPNSPFPADLSGWSNEGGVEVEYLGELQSTEEIFNRSRIACVPSTFAAPYPTVVLEALRAGCVVVASELGGAREALIGAVAELVPPGDSKALASALSRQLNSWDAEAEVKNKALFMQRHTYTSFKHRLSAVPEIASLTSGKRAS